MPIESFSYIPQLVATNPIHTDPLAQADSHLRGIKQTLLNQFPAFTGMAVTATEAQLNASAGLVSVTAGSVSAPVPNPALAAPNANQGGSFVLNGVAGQMDICLVNLGGSLGFMVGNASGGASTTWTSMGTFSTAGAFQAVGTIGGSDVLKGTTSLVPVGCILLWYGSVASVPAGWSLCNGQTVSGHTTPNLSGRFVIHADGAAYLPGAIGGASVVTVTSTAAGSHNHGGADGAAGSWQPGGSTDAQGSHSHGGSAGAVGLSVAQLPPHTHNVIGYTVNPQTGGSIESWGSTNGSAQSTPTDGGNGLQGQAHGHPIGTDGLHAHNLNISPAPNHQHSISIDGNHSHNVSVTVMPPYYALAYIMRTA